MLFRSPTNTGHLVVALKIERFSPLDEFKRRVDAVIRDIRNSKKMPGIERIRVPGEQSHAIWVERSATGVPVHETLLTQFKQLASDLGIEGLG